MEPEKRQSQKPTQVENEDENLLLVAGRSLPSLPNELLCKILTHVSTRDLLSCRLVSKNWNQVATCLYRDRPDCVKIYHNFVFSTDAKKISSNNRFNSFLKFLRDGRRSKTKENVKDSNKMGEPSSSSSLSLPSPFSRLVLSFARLDMKKPVLSEKCGALSADLLGDFIKYVDLVHTKWWFMMDPYQENVFNSTSQRVPVTRHDLDNFLLELLHHLPNVQEISFVQTMEHSVMTNFLECSLYEMDTLRDTRFFAGWSWPISVFVQSTVEDKSRPSLIQHHLQDWTVDHVLAQAEHVQYWKSAERVCHCFYCGRRAKDCFTETDDGPGNCHCSGCSCRGEDEPGGNRLDLLGRLMDPLYAPPVTVLNLSLYPQKLSELPRNFWDFFPRLKNLHLEFVYDFEWRTFCAKRDKNKIDSFFTGFLRKDCERLEKDGERICWLKRKKSSILQLDELATVLIVLRKEHQDHGKTPLEKLDPDYKNALVAPLGITKVSWTCGFDKLKNPPRVSIKILDFPLGRHETEGERLLNPHLLALEPFADSLDFHTSGEHGSSKSSAEWTLVDRLA